MSTRSERVDADLLRQWGLPDPGDSKKDRGDLVIVGASRRTPGAVILAFEAAMRVGAGRAAVLVPGSIDAQIAGLLPEAAVLTLPDRPDDPMPERAAASLGRADAVLIGPGFDDIAETRSTLEAILATSPRRLVVDAYGLGVLPDVDRDSVPDDLILTPNKDEVAILLDEDVDDLTDGLRAVADRYGAVVASYGQVVEPDGTLWLIEGVSAGLATAGSGDVLAGAITGFVARGVPAPRAAIWGLWAHARAGARLTATHGLGFLARELAAELPFAVLDATGAGTRDATRDGQAIDGHPAED